MARLACVDLPALPLQLLLHQHPGWRGLPVAVVSEDLPQAPILWVNEQARRKRILPGARYAEGLSRASDLRAAPVSSRQIDQAVQKLQRILLEFSPEVEPGEQPGLFFLNAEGLNSIYPSLKEWGQKLLAALKEHSFSARAAIGFSRFGSYALARGNTGELKICDTPEQERQQIQKVPLQRLSLSPALRDALAKLGITSIGDLLGLPGEGLLQRFGPEAEELHAQASLSLRPPLQPLQPLPPAELKVDFDEPEANATRLLFRLKHQLHQLLETLAQRKEALQLLRFSLHLDLGWQDETSGEALTHHSLRPAEPTLCSRQLSDLLRLKLEAIARQGGLARGVVAVELAAQGFRATREQLQLFAQQPRRDLRAANRALARLRAELGDPAVCQIVLQDRHLPEARFRFEPLHELPAPTQSPAQSRPQLVRRLLSPQLLRSQRGRLLDSAAQPLLRVAGPFVLSGGWWRSLSGTCTLRSYYYARGPDGALLWIYFDARRQRWLLQGRVE